MLDRQPELKSAAYLSNRQGLKIIKELMCKIFTDLTQGTIKVLHDSQAGHKCERQALVRPSFSESEVEGGGTTMDNPSKIQSMDWGGATVVLSQP
jgi:hypothetical protein